MHREELVVDVRFLLDNGESVVSSLLADLDALGVSLAKVADGSLIVPWVKEGNLTWASLDTESTTVTGIPVHKNGTSILID
jgi:hypothetical protein